LTEYTQGAQFLSDLHRQELEQDQSKIL
jgi:hypothetical protein